jgi:hypothetical protein
MRSKYRTVNRVNSQVEHIKCGGAQNGLISTGQYQRRNERTTIAPPQLYGGSHTASPRFTVNDNFIPPCYPQPKLNADFLRKYHRLIHPSIHQKLDIELTNFRFRYASVPRKYYVIAVFQRKSFVYRVHDFSCLNAGAKVIFFLQNLQIEDIFKSDMRYATLQF